MCGVMPVGSQVPDIFAQVCQMYYQPLSEIILKTSVSPEKQASKQANKQANKHWLKPGIARIYQTRTLMAEVA